MAAAMWRTPRRVCLLVLTPLMMLPMASASASAPPQLRVVCTTASALQASVVVAVPWELSNRALPPSAFGMRQGGLTVPIKVRRVAETGLDVHVVIDPAGTNTAAVWQKSAAADLLRLLPPTVRTSVATAHGGVRDPRQGNAAALRALAEVQPRPAAPVDRTLNQIAGAARNGRKHLIVPITSCPQNSTTDIKPLKGALSNGTSQLDIIGFGRGCRSRLLPLARDHGGLTLATARPSQLAQAVDTIAYDTLGQYQLSLLAPAKATALVLTVDFAGVHAASRLRLPIAATGQATAPALNTPASVSAAPAAGAPANDPGAWRLRALLAVAATSILLVELVAALRVAAGRRSRRRASNAVDEKGWHNPASAPPSDRPNQAAPTGWLVKGAAGSVALADPAAVTRPDSASEDGTDTATTQPVRDERASGDLPLEPVVASDAPKRRLLAFPASGLTDGTVRVRLPDSEDARALQDFVKSEGGLAGVWEPPPGPGTGDREAVIDSWSRTWGGGHPPAWSWPSSSSAGRESSARAGAAQPIAPPRPSSLGRGLGLIVERTEEDGLIGYVGVREKPNAVEVSYGTSPRHQQQDYTRRAVLLVTHWLAQHDPLRHIQTVILPSDDMSRSIARDVGFVPTGTVWTFVPATGMMALSVCFEFEPGRDAAE